jgi:flagellar protein FlaE
MRLDPINYDVAELRRFARRRGRTEADGFVWPDADTEGFPVDELTEYDREATWTGSGDERQKPYLRELPTGDAARAIVHDWLELLVERSGSRGAVEVLDYYESLGWITEAVEADLHDHFVGVRHVPGGALSDIDSRTHIESLSRVVALARLVDEIAKGRRRGDGADGADADAADVDG